MIEIRWDREKISYKFLTHKIFIGILMHFDLLESIFYSIVYICVSVLCACNICEKNKNMLEIKKINKSFQ